MASSLSELRSRINSINPYSSTYTYLKYCKNYIVGYSFNGVQILKMDCLYGGIRDIVTAIKSSRQDNIVLMEFIRGYAKSYKDFVMFIQPQLYKGESEISGLLKGVFKEAQFSFNELIRGWASGQSDIIGYIKQIGIGQSNLYNYIRSTFADYLDLSTLLKGWVREAFRYLGNYIKSTQQSTKDLSEYIRPFHIYNLNINLQPIPSVNLGVYIQHNDRVVNLFCSVRSKYFNNIGGFVRCMYINDLISILVPVEPVDISAGIITILPINLGFYLFGELGPYRDVAAYLNSVTYKNLLSTIFCFGGIRIPINLKTLIQGYQLSNLSASLSAVPSQDLAAILYPKGQSVILSARIVPKVVYFRSIINVALLEHIDLKAIINYSCFYSDWVSLSARLYCFSKHDLYAYIRGTLQNSATTYKDLKVYINYYNYITEDTLPIEFVAVPNTLKYTNVNINYTTEIFNYKTIDSILIKYYSLWHKDLNIKIKGVLYSKDLSAYIKPVFDFNYSQLPSWINPRTYEVVLDLRVLSTQAKRFVEIMFDAVNEKPFYYFYVNGENKVYRMNRDRHWSIKTIGYTKVKDSEVERIFVRNKYTFDLSNYSTIDEAVRSLIARAANYTEYNLSASIDGTLPPFLNLPIGIYGTKTKCWMKRLAVRIQPLVIRDFILAVRAGQTDIRDLSLNIYKILQRSDISLTSFIRMWHGSSYDMKCTVRWYRGVYDCRSYLKQVDTNLDNPVELGCIITPKQYVKPVSNDIVFNFEGSEYTVPIASGIVLDFNAGALTWQYYDYEPPQFNVIKITRSSIEILRKE